MTTDEALARMKEDATALDKTIDTMLAKNADLTAERDRLRGALGEAERVIRWAAQEATGKVKAEIVGGWIHHADIARAALAGSAIHA